MNSVPNLPALRPAPPLPAGIQPLSIAEALTVTKQLAGNLVTDESHPLRYCVSASVAPTEREKALICDARNRMVEHLRPSDRKTLVEALIAKLLLGFDKGRGPSPEQAARLNGEFMEAVQLNDRQPPIYHPLWAIKAAATRYRKAQTITKWDPEFRPNPGQFAAEVRAGMLPHRTMISQADRILSATVRRSTATLPEQDRPAVIERAMSAGAIGGVLPPNEVAREEERAERRARAEAALERRQAASDAGKARARHERRHGGGEALGGAA